MSLNASHVKSPVSGVKQEPLAPGSYPARLVQVIDLGRQLNKFDPEKEARQEIMLTYELPTEFTKDKDGNEQPDKPRWVSEQMALCSIAADLAKSTKRIKAIDPANQFKGDLIAMLGLPCIVTMVINPSKKDDKVYNNVSLVAPPMKGFEIPPLKNTPSFFSLENPDLETFDKLPKWIQDLIKNNVDFTGSKLDLLLGGTVPNSSVKQVEANTDDVPF